MGFTEHLWAVIQDSGTQYKQVEENKQNKFDGAQIIQI